MKQKIFALALTLGLASMGLKAADGVTFYTDQREAVTIDEIEMIVAADNQETFNVVLTNGTTLTDVVFLTTDNLSGVDKVATDTPQLLVANDVMHINGCKASQVTIYSVNGQTLLQQDVNGSADINISHLESGVYLLQAGKTTMKFVKH